jgi:hypothetical protein
MTSDILVMEALNVLLQIRGKSAKGCTKETCLVQDSIYGYYSLAPHQHDPNGTLRNLSVRACLPRNQSEIVGFHGCARYWHCIRSNWYALH